MSSLDRCDRYRAGEPSTCASHLFAVGTPCAYCATLLTPFAAPRCGLCRDRGYYLEDFTDDHFTPCVCAAGGGARPVT